MNPTYPIFELSDDEAELIVTEPVSQIKTRPVAQKRLRKSNPLRSSYANLFQSLRTSRTRQAKLAHQLNAHDDELFKQDIQLLLRNEQIDDLKSVRAILIEKIQRLNEQSIKDADWIIDAKITRFLLEDQQEKAEKTIFTLNRELFRIRMIARNAIRRNNTLKDQLAAARKEDQQEPSIDIPELL